MRGSNSLVVPAEVIAVADRLVGNLSLFQAFLLAVPLGLAGLSLLAPPKMVLVPYKVLLVVLVAGICVPLAVRYQERLLGQWLVVGWRFCFRPRRWVLSPPANCRIRTKERL